MKYLDVIGIDEVGRGCLAGPVFVVACYLPPNFPIEILKDSKKTTKPERIKLYKIITNHQGVIFKVSKISEQTIDKINIFQAVKLGVISTSRRIKKLINKPIFVDGNHKFTIADECVVKGDSKIASISAASIIAKYQKDLNDARLDKLFPGYDFAQNASYGTKKHLEAIKKRGLTPVHRKTFAKTNLKMPPEDIKLKD